jgi:hypothetical protein
MKELSPLDVATSAADQVRAETEGVIRCLTEACAAVTGAQAGFEAGRAKPVLGATETAELVGLKSRASFVQILEAGGWF